MRAVGSMLRASEMAASTRRCSSLSCELSEMGAACSWKVLGPTSMWSETERAER